MYDYHSRSHSPRSPSLREQLVDRNLGTLVPRVGHLFPLPTPRASVPNAIRKQPMQIGKVWITVDVEVQPFAIVLARPLATGTPVQRQNLAN